MKPVNRATPQEARTPLADFPPRPATPERKRKAAPARAEPPAPSGDDADVAIARRLLYRLRDEGLLETTRGFDPEAVASAIADEDMTPAGVIDLLVDRADVVEVYASEEEIAARLAELRGQRG